MHEELIDLSSAVRLFAFLALSGIAFRLSFANDKRPKAGEPQLPPGPKLDPIIGHLRFVDAQQPWRTFAEWGKKWGEYQCIPLKQAKDIL